jgi:hypothetical protein
MEILEIIKQIPAAFYLSLALLPAAVWGFFAVSKPKKTILAKNADPAEQLKTKKVNFKKEIRSGLLLGTAIAAGLGLFISLGIVIGDYKNDRGIFAAVLPPLSLPPAPEAILPPAPGAELDGKAN